MNSDRATGIRITAARYGISEAGTVSPSAGVNGQARPFALTPCVPLSRRAGEGGLWSAEAELPPTLKLRFSTPNGTACGSPLAHAEGLEVRAKEDVPYGRA